MSSDEHPESLASQAASWVPPWERPQREPDRDYQASATASDEPPPDDDEDRSSAGLSEDDDDFDPAFEGPNPPGYPTEGVPDELPPIPGETGAPPTVDAPVELPGDDAAEPTDVGVEPDVAVPASIEAAVADDDDEAREAVDAMLPPDGDDAGDVFDAAADDDVSDDGEMDLPFRDDIPADDDDSSVRADDPDGGDSDASVRADEPDGGDSDASVRADEPDGGDSDASAPADDPDEPVDAFRHLDASSDDDDPHGRSTSAADDAADGDVRVATDAAAVGFAAGQADAEAALSGEAAVTRPKPSGVPAQVRGSRGRPAASADSSARTRSGVDVDGEEPAPVLMDEAELRPALEAILLVVDEPVQEMQLAQILEQPTERVAEMLEDISARYTAAGHGFDLRRAAGGWRLYTRPEYAAYVERFVLDGQSVRLTQAALETLAVVAYKQPVTRSRISAIRGVNCDGVMRTLVTRSLIEECGIEGETGAHLYRTTTLFLEKLGLNSVDQLPPLAPFLPDDVEEVLDGSG